MNFTRRKTNETEGIVELEISGLFFFTTKRFLQGKIKRLQKALSM